MFRSTGVSMKSGFILGTIDSPKGVMKLVSHLKLFDTNEVAKERQRIICFYDTYGEKATKEAFNIDRKIIYVWKKRIKKAKSLTGLIPYSTKPKTLRKSVVDSKTINFIKNQREFVPRMSKKKLKPILDEYCKKENLSLISEATIGRIIKRNNFFSDRSGKVYHNPSSKYAQRKSQKVRRVNHAPHPTDFGYVQLDTVEKIIDGTRWYMYQAIDVKGKAALSLTYKHLNSQNTVDFIKKFQLILPYKIRIVQTDNGKEFKKYFSKYLEDQNIPHLFTYPKHPKINGVVERFNRTIQEDFIDPNLDLIYDQKAYNLKLSQYLIYYNCQRIHESLNNMTPINFLIQKGGMSNMLGSCTRR